MKKIINIILASMILFSTTTIAKAERIDVSKIGVNKAEVEEVSKSFFKFVEFEGKYTKIEIDEQTALREAEKINARVDRSNLINMYSPRVFSKSIEELPDVFICEIVASEKGFVVEGKEKVLELSLMYKWHTIPIVTLTDILELDYPEFLHYNKGSARFEQQYDIVRFDSKSGELIKVKTVKESGYEDIRYWNEGMLVTFDIKSDDGFFNAGFARGHEGKLTVKFSLTPRNYEGIGIVTGKYRHKVIGLPGVSLSNDSVGLSPSELFKYTTMLSTGREIDSSK